MSSGQPASVPTSRGVSTLPPPTQVVNLQKLALSKEGPPSLGGFGREGAVRSGQQRSGPRRSAGNKIRWRRGGVERTTTQGTAIQALVPTILLRHVGPSWRTAPWRSGPRPTL